MIRAMMMALAACGGGRLSVVPRPLPPNTDQICSRAEQCQIFLTEQHAVCVNCLEHVDEALVAKLERDYGPLPSLEQTDCATLTKVAQSWTNIAECVAGRWYGP